MCIRDSYYAYEGQLYDGSDEVFDGFYAIGSLYPEAVQLMVAADSDITDVSPVSYTHLDVYKRQGLRRTPTG